MPELRHLTDWSDLPAAVWDAALARTLAHGTDKRWSDTARGRALGLLLFNPSLRTRVSMEMAAAHLGAVATVLTPGQGTWNLEHRDGVRMDGDRAEHVREAVGVLGHYLDALGVRTFASLTDEAADRADAVLRAVVAASAVPVVNLESARWHPCQALADAAAICEAGEPAGRTFVLSWAPHPNPLPRAVPNSAVMMAARLGMRVVVARPDGFALDADVMDLARDLAARAGGSVSETTDQMDAVAGAHVVYAKAWSGGSVYADRAGEAASRAAHAGWTVTEQTMAATDDGTFMHCLPVRRGVVVADAVLDGPRARHHRQAAYRLAAQKSILEWLWHLDAGDADG